MQGLKQPASLIGRAPAGLCQAAQTDLSHRKPQVGTVCEVSTFLQESLRMTRWIPDRDARQLV